jgi:hypothetical protein
VKCRLCMTYHVLLLVTIQAFSVIIYQFFSRSLKTQRVMEFPALNEEAAALSHHIQDLDSFLIRAYAYFYHGGLINLVTAQTTALLNLAFMIALSTSLLLVDWVAVVRDCSESNCDGAIYDYVVSPWSRSRTMGAFSTLFVLFAFAYFCWKALRAIKIIVDARGMREFYEKKLFISQNDLLAQSWKDVVHAIASLPERVSVHPGGLSEAEVACRIMRKDNWLMALIRAGALDLRLPAWLWFLQGRNNSSNSIIGFSRCLEFCLQFIIVEHMYNPPFTATATATATATVGSNADAASVSPHSAHGTWLLGLLCRWSALATNSSNSSSKRRRGGHASTYLYHALSSVSDDSSSSEEEKEDEEGGDTKVMHNHKHHDESHRSSSGNTDPYEISSSFLSDPSALRSRFILVGTILLLLLPFMLAFQTLHFMLSNAAEFTGRHGSSGSSSDMGPSLGISHLCRWQSRRFNELPHQLDRRLNTACHFAGEYVSHRAFHQPSLLHAAQTICFVSGALTAVLLALSITCEGAILGLSLLPQTGAREGMAGGHNLLWLLGVCSAIYATTRSYSHPARQGRIIRTTLPPSSSSSFIKSASASASASAGDDIDDSGAVLGDERDEWRMECREILCQWCVCVRCPQPPANLSLSDLRYYHKRVISMFPHKVSLFVQEILSAAHTPLLLLSGISSEQSCQRIVEFVAEHKQWSPRLGDLVLGSSPSFSTPSLVSAPGTNLSPNFPAATTSSTTAATANERVLGTRRGTPNYYTLPATTSNHGSDQLSSSGDNEFAAAGSRAGANLPTHSEEGEDHLSASGFADDGSSAATAAGDPSSSSSLQQQQQQQQHLNPSCSGLLRTVLRDEGIDYSVDEAYWRALAQAAVDPH